MGPLIGREREQARVGRFADAALAGSARLLVLGEPGIGKTALLQASLETLRPRFRHVLAHRALDAEQGLPLAALSDALVGPLLEVADELPPPRRRALEVALLLTDPSVDDRTPTSALALAFLDLLRALARTGPVLIVLDDLQWVDRSSASLLRFALRRLADEPIGVLAAARAGESATDWESSFGVNERLELAPLDVAALRRLLAERAGIRLPRPRLVRLYEQTRGNALYALEMARVLDASPDSPSVMNATVADLLAARLARMRASAREVLLVAAAHGAASPDLLARIFGPDSTDRALSEAAGAGIARLEQDRVRFSHPLLASGVYEIASPWQRQWAHEQLARALDDPDQRALHLALARPSPDEALARDLDAATERMARRGTIAEAIVLAELAVARTPERDPASHAARMLRAADLNRLAGDRARAGEMLRSVLARHHEPEVRADALFCLARCRAADLETTIRYCEEALAAVGTDPRRGTDILAFASWMRILQGDTGGALTDARRSLELAETTRDPRRLCRAIARVGMAETWSLAETAGLLERGVALEEELDRPLEFHESPRIALARRLLARQQLVRARELFEEAYAVATTAGDEGTRCHVLFHLVQLETDAGDLRRALAHADEALDLAEQLEDEQLVGMVLNVKGFVDALLGNEEIARSGLARGLEIARRIGDELFVLQHEDVLGALELSLGNIEAAAAHLRGLPERLQEVGMVEASDMAWPNAIEVLAELGEGAAAHALLERFSELAVLSGGGWARGAAARCKGLLAAVEGDVATAESAFEVALAEHADIGRPLDLGRTLLAQGRVARRFRKRGAAREAFGRALEIFEEGAATLWAERAREELERISGRRKDASLTPSEERVASLAAQGFSNKEIAATLFVSVHTVEAHLSRVYRKLEIRSRSQLAARLGPARALQVPSSEL